MKNRTKTAVIPVGVTSTLSRSNRIKGPRERARWVFNTRLFLVTLGVVVLIVPAAIGWHALQVYWHASAFLEQAARHREREEWDEAFLNLEHYIALRPRDVDARVQFAEVLDKVSTGGSSKQRVSEEYALAIGLAPDRIDLQIRHAEVLLDAEAYAQALTQAQRVLSSMPDEPRSFRVLALARLAELGTVQRVDREALHAFYRVADTAVEHLPHDVALVRRLATGMRSWARGMAALGSSDRETAIGWANQLMDDLVERNPEDVEALLTRYAYRLSENLGDADSDLERAAELDQDSPEVLIALAQRELRRSNPAAAQRYLRRLLETSPQRREGYLLLASSLREGGELGEALRVVERGLRASDDTDLPLRMERISLLIAANSLVASDPTRSLGRMHSEAEMTQRRDNLKDAEQYLESLEGEVALLANRLGARDGMELLEKTLMLRAYWHIARGESGTAVQLLQDRFSERPSSSPDTPEGQRHGQALELLGRTHAGLKRWDLAAAAFERAARMSPDRLDLVLAAAESHERNGNWNRARILYQRLRRSDPPPPGIGVALCRIELHALRDPTADANSRARNAAALELELAVARAAGDRREALDLLEAEFHILQEQDEDAERLLDRSSDTLRGAERELASELYARMDRPEKSARLARRSRGEFSDENEQKIFAATRSLREGNLAEAISLLTPTATDTEVSAGDHGSLELLAPLVRLLLVANQPRQALYWNAELRAAQPEIQVWVYEWAEIARLANDADELGRALDELRHRDGPRGSQWPEIRLRVILDHPNPLPANLVAEAEQLLDQLKTERPEWSAPWALAAKLRQRMGNTSEAINHYLEAVRLADRSFSTLASTSRLLLQTYRLSDASYFLRLVNQTSPLEYWREIDLPAFVESIRAQQALDEVQAAASSVGASGGSQDRGAVGHALLAGRNAREARAWYESQIKSDGSDLEAWTGWLAALWLRGERGEFEEGLRQLAQMNETATHDRDFLLGHGHELLGDLEQAARYYLRALDDDAAPRDRAEQYVMLVTQWEPRRAVEALSERVRHAPGDSFARRTLAYLLAALGGEQRLQQAWNLLDDDSGDGNSSQLLDARLRAILVLRRPNTPRLREAMERLERAAASSRDFSTEDHMMLAELHRRLGNMAQMEENLNVVLDRRPDSVAALRRLFDVQFERQALPDAESTLSRLEQTAPHDLATIGRRARWLSAMERPEEARQVLAHTHERLLAMPMNDGERVASLMTVGELFEEVTAWEEAEKAYQQAYKTDPGTLATLLGFLVRVGRAEEAIDLCRQLAERDQDSDASAIEHLCRVLSYAPVSTELARELDPIIREALSRHPEYLPLHFSAATYFQIRGERDIAVELYRGLVRRLPDQPRILNNFAYLLAELPEGLDEAERLVQRAISLDGKTQQRLDTQGMIHFRREQWEEARRSFQEAAQLATVPEATTLFHLALAQQRLGDLDAARESLRAADTAGLSRAVLSAGDLELLQKLYQELES